MLTGSAGIMSMLTRVLAMPLLGLIWVYRMCLSPLLGANCRHLPTCSEYARDAVILHGPLRGGIFALKRISRCHPWADPAFDPVPDDGNGSGDEPGRRRRKI